MEGHGLSHGERRTLDVIEDALRREAAALDRQLRTMTPRVWHRLADLLRRPMFHVLMAFGIVSIVLFVAAVRTSSTAVVWAFSGCWTMALVAAGRVSGGGHRLRGIRPRGPGGGWWRRRG